MSQVDKSQFNDWRVYDDWSYTDHNPLEGVTHKMADLEGTKILPDECYFVLLHSAYDGEGLANIWYKLIQSKVLTEGGVILYDIKYWSRGDIEKSDRLLAEDY